MIVAKAQWSTTQLNKTRTGGQLDECSVHSHQSNPLD